jgi:hypothetical protein
MSNENGLIATIEAQKQELRHLQQRTLYKRAAFEKAIALVGKNSIKAITGPRRAGKSTFGMQLATHFSARDDFIYLNFDDQFLIEVKNHHLLNNAIDHVYGDRKSSKRPKLILLDEIQNLAKWELWLNYLQRMGDNLIVTGSNANLLSRELSTHLTGRSTEIEILPFSYTEYKKTGGTFESFYESSGFPDVLFNAQDKRTYIEGLKDSVLLKDIIQRFNLRNSVKIEACFDIIMSNPASLLSYKSIAKAVAVKSETTVRKYLQYLSDTYLFFELLPFSFKAKTFYRSAKKCYLIDNGFIDLASQSVSKNLSKKLENLVFLELIKSGLKPNRTLFYYRTKNNLEVDFLVKEQLSINKLIQVSHSIDNLEARERESRALVTASRELKVNQLQIITWKEEDQIKVDGYNINVIPVEKYLASRENLY